MQPIYEAAEILGGVTGLILVTLDEAKDYVWDLILY